jgi:dolichol-phosphate mannosyltransferase
MLISLVIPVFNEEEMVEELYNQTTKALDSITRDWEVICVNDGSRDNTLSLLVSLYEKDKRWKVISLSRNFGHQRALWAGLSYAQGDYIGVMDGDLQDDPVYFTDFLKKFTPNVDVIYATRAKRKEGFLLRLAFHSYYLIIKNIFGIDIPLDSGDFGMMRKKVVKEIISMPEHSLFIRGIRAWVGFNQIGMVCERNKRFKGKTKYSIRKRIRFAYDGMFSFSDFPIKFLGRLGLFIIGLSITYAAYILVKKIILNHVVEGFTTLIIAIMFFGGVQLITVRILGEYLYRIYNESRKRPLYVIGNTYGDLVNQTE